MMQQIYQKYGKRTLLFIAVYSLIYVVVWSALTSFLPNGCWVTAINVIFWIGSLVFIALAPLQILKLVGMSTTTAAILTVLFWGAFVIGIRSAFLSVFGA